MPNIEFLGKVGALPEFTRDAKAADPMGDSGKAQGMAHLGAHTADDLMVLDRDQPPAAPLRAASTP